jgi:hypothetical protein
VRRVLGAVRGSALEALAVGLGGGQGAGWRAEFDQDVFDVGGDGVLSDEQVGVDALVGPAAASGRGEAG